MLATSLTAAVVVTAFVAPRFLGAATRPLQSNEQKLVGSWRFICPDHIHFDADRTWRYTTINDWELESGHWALSDSDHLLMQTDQQPTHSLDDGLVKFIDAAVVEVRTGQVHRRLSRTGPAAEADDR